MSYDLIFAKPTRPIPKEREEEAYHDLTHDKPGELFASLPLDEINKALIEHYEDFEPATGTGIENEAGSAEVGHSAYHFWFSFRGNTDEMKDRIVEIFRRFDCPVFDPQCDGLQPLDLPWGSPPGKSSRGFQKLFTRELQKLQAQVAAQEPEVREVLERELAEVKKSAADLRQKQEENRAKAAAARQKEEQNREEADRKANPQKYELIAQIEKECAGGRWQRLGMTAKQCGESIFYSPDMTSESEDRSSIPITASRRLVELRFLEAIPASQPSYDSVAVAKRAAAMAVKYLFGDWQESIPRKGIMGLAGKVDKVPLSREEMREDTDWIEPYREGVLLSLYSDDESSFQKLIKWPDTDLPVDDGIWNLTAADNQAHIALAFILRGEPQSKVDQILADVLAGGRKRAVTFASAAQAFANDDADAFARHLKELSKLYLKKPPMLVRDQRPELHVDGAILWHLGLRKKFPLPELPEKNLDLILRR